MRSDEKQASPQVLEDCGPAQCTVALDVLVRHLEVMTTISCSMVAYRRASQRGPHHSDSMIADHTLIRNPRSVIASAAGSGYFEFVLLLLLYVVRLERREWRTTLHDIVNLFLLLRSTCAMS